MPGNSSVLISHRFLGAVMLFHASFHTSIANCFLSEAYHEIDVDVLGLDRQRTVTPQTGTRVIIVLFYRSNVGFNVKFWLCSSSETSAVLARMRG